MPLALLFVYFLVATGNAEKFRDALALVGQRSQLSDLFVQVLRYLLGG